MYKKAYGGEYFAFTFLALVIERGVNALTAYLGNLALGPSGQTAVEICQTRYLCTARDGLAA